MDFSISELLALCGGVLRSGDSEFHVRGFASLIDAESHELSFLGNEKYLSDYLSTRAGAVLVTPEAPTAREGMVVIDVANPSLAFSQIIEALQAKRAFEPEVHPTAFVDETAQVEGVMIRANAVVEAGAQIGKGTEIGPGVVVERDAVIGEDCLLYANAVVRERCILGNRVLLQPGVVIGSEGYGYELVDGKHRLIPQVGIVVLGDEVEVGANSTIDRARFGKTVIGEGTKLDNLVQIGHNAIVGKNCLIVAQTGIAGSSEIGNSVTIAAQSGVAGHLKITDNVTLAARTGVAKSITNSGVYWGTPAIPIQEEKKRLMSALQLPLLRKQLLELQKKVEDLENSAAD